MAKPVKEAFLVELAKRYGPFRKLDKSQSLYELHDSRVRLYLRYSKVHDRKQTFYGLRDEDLRQLEGHPSVICLLWNDQSEPLVIPFSNYEEVFHTVKPATDGQYKAQVYIEEGGTELYLAQAGRFNVEGNFGWAALDNLARGDGIRAPMDLSHCQVTIYSGLLRFNDVHLVAPQLRPTFSIVANDVRRNVFVKQLNRPTFRMNGLDEVCTFLDYINVFEWYSRLRPQV